MEQNEMRNKIRQIFAAAIQVLQESQHRQEESIFRAAELLVSTIRKGGKILACGNGGSAADAQHFAAELVVRLRSSFNRPAIAALALTTDTSILTAGANDYGFEQVFARQIEALGQSGDVLAAFSTSGNSANVIQAAQVARKKNIPVIGFLGGDGGKLKQLVDIPLIVPSMETARIQEVHGVMIHILCELLETALFA